MKVRHRCGVCAELHRDAKQVGRRARYAMVQPCEVCACGWITAREVCPMCGLERVQEVA